MLMGRTRGYRKVVFPGDGTLIGELIDIHISDATTTILKGTPLIKDSSPTIGSGMS